ncbi:MAG: hypothetical protein K0R31_543 [Clostridiales bacterium]|nr:hypothetical protein [Clostridiales bacterium]
MHTGREAIAFMATGMALILLAAAFFLTKRNIDIGKDFLDQTVQTTDNASSQVISESFGEIVNQPMKMPASGVYVLLAYNETHIKSITCYICNPSGKVSNSLTEACLKNHLTGEVKVWAEKDLADGNYNIYLSSEINTLTHGEKILSPAEVRAIVSSNKYSISNMVCNICGNNYNDIETSCLFDNTHAKVKSFRTTTNFNNSSKKYTVYIGE